MPLTEPEMNGTEKDGGKSSLYCKYCYKDGEFTNPTITLAEMRNRVSSKMIEQNMPADIIESAIDRLPFLKRWRKKTKSPENHMVESGPLEKLPLTEPPAPGHLAETEDELDLISGEDPDETAPYDQKEY